MFYLNPSKSILVNSQIIEWDIHSANVSIMRGYNLASETKIAKIEKLDKKKRVITVGQIMRDDPAFSKALEESFNDIVDTFMLENDLDKDDDVLSIKRDAVFVINKSVKTNSFKNNAINFVNKNQYHAFLYLRPFEFYFGPDKIDVKGLPDENILLHENGILRLLKDIIEICETSNFNRVKASKYMRDFVEAYKRRELDFDFYREFSQESKFAYYAYEEKILTESCTLDMLQQIDIESNYKNIILPLIRLVC